MQTIKETRYLWMKWKLCEEKNHFGAARPRISTIPKTKLVTRHSYSHTSDVVVILLTLTRSPSWMLPNQVSYLKGSSIESFTLGSTPVIDFTWNKEHILVTARELVDLQFSLKPFIYRLTENLILLKIELWRVGVRTEVSLIRTVFYDRFSRIAQLFP
jgi:hypothetical protein